MKKIYLASILFVSASFAFGQKVTERVNTSKFSPSNHSTQKVSPQNQEKANYLTEDFENWPLTGWTIASGPASTITNPALQTWHQRASGNPGNCAGVSYVNSVDVHDEYLISPELALPATGNFRLVFDFSTSIYWHVTPNDNVDITVQISTDNGLSWGEILWQEDDDALLAATYSSGWETFTWKTAFCNISSYAGGNVKFRFKYLGQDGAQFDLDNVIVEDIPDNNLKVLASFCGDIVNDFDYSMIPLAQVKPMVIGVAFQNQGALVQTGKDINGAINFGGTDVYNDDINVSVPVGEVDTIWYTTGYTPATVGTYAVNFSLPTDDVAGDNSGNVSYKTTNFIYAHDFNTNNTFGFDNPAEYSIGNLYVIENDADLTGAQVQFATGTVAGVEVSVSVYKVISSIQDMTYVDGVNYVVESGDIGNMIDIPFLDPVSLSSGEQYVLEVRKFGSDLIYIAASNTGDSDNSTVSYGPWGTNDAVNFFNGWSSAPAVRMNFDPSLSINNNGQLSGVKVFPNPSTGMINVTNDLNIENTITVVDLTGKVVASKVASNATTIDLSKVGTGIYMVEISNANGKKVERVVIK